MQLPMVFLDGPWRMAMGLRPLAPADWLWRDDQADTELALRRRLIAESAAEVIACRPGMEPACGELLAMVEDHLARDHGLAVTPSGAIGEAALARLGRLVQEDFCLLAAADDGAYRLRAGVLCFPSHWTLRGKLDLPLAAIHDPVPGFAQKLAAPADRFMTALEPERPVWRANWSLVEHADLPAPEKRKPVPGLTSANAGERLWLRVERQTLRRLPASRAIVFTIRSFVRALGEVARAPGVAAAIAARLREMPPGMAGYKGLPLIGEAVLPWLDRIAEETALPPRAELPA